LEARAVKTVVITGAQGFIGRNLCASLSQRGELDLVRYDLGDSWEDLAHRVRDADCVVHLAGVNRPRDPDEFDKGNRGLTLELVNLLLEAGRPIALIFASSIQAAVANPYGVSKKAAEDAILEWSRQTGNRAYIYRLPNVFGKWSRPNYNSVVATFCHNVARGLPIEIHDPGAEITLAYIDDVVEELVSAVEDKPNTGEDGFCHIRRTLKLTVQQLADMVRAFRDSRTSLIMPNLESDLARFLYATFVSFLPQDGLGYALDMKRDDRGWLTEFTKSRQSGQVFISRTKPGITRGNHWHHTKVEKFLVIEGDTVIRLRRLDSDEVIEVQASGTRLRVVDIPPGYTHSITNVGKTDVITLFWADEVFDPVRPDTYFAEV
jgi:UDP-2-acetamido-2,6-beta-L-arabino-hexul-4-ose reductase